MMMAQPVHVAYLVTHYPSPSHTFIYGEIRAIENLGAVVSPMSVNAISESDILSPEDRTESARTYYVKSQQRPRIVGQLLWFTVRRPAAVGRVLRMALGSCRWDLHALVWHLFYVLEGILVLRRCEAVGATHLHSHFGGTPSTIAMYASALSHRGGIRRLPWSVTIHGFHEFTNERAALLDAKVADAEFVVAISDFTRSQLMRIVKDPALWPKVRVIRCGIDLDRFTYAPHKIGTRVRIVSTARVVAEKGIGVLFDALAQLVSEGHNLDLTLIGDGPAKTALERRAVELGLTDRVRWLGMQPPAEVRRWLSESDIFCLPSFAEGLPIVVMEAMAVGVPVVATYLGGIPELVETGRTGILVAAGRCDALAAAIREMSVPSNQRDNIIKAARHRVEESHEIHRSAQQLFDLLQAAVA